MIPVFDGHNDILLRLLLDPARRQEIFLTGEGKGHLDLPRMKAAGFAGGFFAIYLPSPIAHDDQDYQTLMQNPPYALPLPDLIPFAAAIEPAVQTAGHLLWMERASEGALKICRTAADVRGCLASGTIAAILHMEGAEAIDDSLDALHLFHAMGLRSLGPVWSRPTIFGHGVPFAFPSSPDTGPGLTDAGKRLVAECNRLRIMLDLSHMNEAGFNDVARLSDAPLVATHSNAHAICPSSRNLTDRQLDMIRDSGGMVGLNFSVSFLRPDGRQMADTGWDPILRQMDYLLEKLREDHLGFGSDYDGCTTPDVIGDVMGLPKLVQALSDHGYDRPLLERLAHSNWLALLDRTL
ncbi:membrane dipeptidase [Tabrizicola piscis]|uniref:Membrane dipeptidase n=1 Tax=Tabrizicola piscis TaxID=2494374 RepID=A0A3S8U998_9RHOB|nr:dipeptidase [Tabrizicola piscis]AZL60167.1 membrane dipeptidase [Tabrizicola piscis]